MLHVPQRLSRIFQAMKDGRWRSETELQTLSGYKDIGRRVRELKAQGFVVETQIISKSPREFQYRLVDASVSEPAKPVNSSFAPHTNPEIKPSNSERWASWPERSVKWFNAARAGMAAAIADKKSGLSSANPYAKNASQHSTWQLAYKSMYFHNKDITAGFVESAPPERADRPKRKDLQSIREALRDWQYQTLGMAFHSLNQDSEPVYCPDPSITDEDKHFAAEQVRKCKSELASHGVRI